MVTSAAGAITIRWLNGLALRYHRCGTAQRPRQRMAFVLSMTVVPGMTRHDIVQHCLVWYGSSTVPRCLVGFYFLLPLRGRLY